MHRREAALLGRRHGVAPVLVIAYVIIVHSLIISALYQRYLSAISRSDQLFFYYTIIVLTDLRDIPFNTYLRHSLVTDSDSSTSGERATAFEQKLMVICHLSVAVAA
jgi:hypothetical protein